MPTATDKAVRHAQDTARLGGSVKDCAYKDRVWRAVWLTSFQEAQQQDLFNQADSDHDQTRLSGF